MKQLLPWYQRLKYERSQRAWSQAELARRVGCSPKNVSRWEKGEIFPGPYNRRKLAEVFEKNIEELGLLEEPDHYYDTKRIEQNSVSTSPSAEVLPAEISHTQWFTYYSLHKEDWGNAPSIEHFYGRQKEIATIEQWIGNDCCRLVAVMGIGGVGKTTLATALSKKVAETFDYIFWRSLQNAPPLMSILDDYFHMIFAQRQRDIPQDLEGCLTLLIKTLRERRCLILFDNVESILRGDQRAGLYIEANADYGQLFRLVGETEHQSCFILTGREKPGDIAQLEGDASTVRSLSLVGLEEADGQKLLQDTHLIGSVAMKSDLVRLYSGNPLALKLVREPIREVFGGDIARFLQEGQTVFGDIFDLMDQQFQRLPTIEQRIMYCLAIEREELTHPELQERIILSATTTEFITSLNSLRRRSMVEDEDHAGHFRLQAVIMEYVTQMLIEHIYSEIVRGTIGLLGSNALLTTRAKDYIRRNQELFILTPIANKLLKTYGEAGSHNKLQAILTTLRQLQMPSYAAGNIINLFIRLHTDLRGFDFSYLTIWNAYLQGVMLPEVNFAAASFARTIFTKTFGSFLSLALSPDSAALAMGTLDGEIRLWQVDSTVPLLTCRGHTDGVRAVTFAKDSNILASGGEDYTVRLWNTTTGSCLSILSGHTNVVRTIAFCPVKPVIASGSEDQTIKLWETSTGRSLALLQGHTGWVRSIAFSPDGSLLASGSDDQTVRIWDITTGACIKVLRGHTDIVRCIAFHPIQLLVASGSADKTLRVWDIHTGQCLTISQGHTHLIRSVTFSPDGSVFASGSDDQTVRLWDTLSGMCLNILKGHASRIWSVVFNPTNWTLISGSEDQTVRYWDITTGHCLKIIQGYSNLVWSVDFRFDGQFLISGSDDHRLRLWDSSTGNCLKVLQGHTNRVRSVAFSPSGSTIVSGSEDQTVRLWDTTTGRCLRVFQGHTNLVRAVAFSPEGETIVSGSHDQTVRLWNSSTGDYLLVLLNSLVWTVAFSPDGQMVAVGCDDATIHLLDPTTGQRLTILQGHTHRIWSVAFSPDRTLLASSSDDQTIRLWDLHTHQCLQTLHGHTQWIRSVAFNADGTLLASGSHDQTIGIWDVYTGKHINTLQGSSGWVWSVAFSQQGHIVAGGNSDGTITLWDINTGKPIRILRIERPYERMNIYKATGLTDSERGSLETLGAIDEIC